MIQLYHEIIIFVIYNKIMTIDDQIIIEKLQHDIKGEAEKILALLSGKINKHEYVIDEEILPSNKR